MQEIWKYIPIYPRLQMDLLKLNDFDLPPVTGHNPDK